MLSSSAWAARSASKQLYGFNRVLYPVCVLKFSWLGSLPECAIRFSTKSKGNDNVLSIN